MKSVNVQEHNALFPLGIMWTISPSSWYEYGCCTSSAVCRCSLIHLWRYCPVGLWREERWQCIAKDGADLSWLDWSQALGNRDFYPPPHPDHRRILFVMEFTSACAPVPEQIFLTLCVSRSLGLVFALQHTDTSCVRYSIYTNKLFDYTVCDLYWRFSENSSRPI